MLEALGVGIDPGPDVVARCINELGIGFLFAPRFHPAMKHAMTPRKELSVKTIFNMLGPLTNPAGAKNQIIGVFAPELTETFANVLKLLGSKRAFIVHGQDGMDEITVTTTTRISELADGNIRTYEFNPLELTGQYANLDDIKGGDPENNAKITREILSGKKGPSRDIVCLNAAAAIVAGGKAAGIKEGWGIAQKTIDNGSAQKALGMLIRITTES